MSAKTIDVVDEHDVVRKLRLAADKARAQVASDPSDEEAARRLVDAVRAYRDASSERDECEFPQSSAVIEARRLMREEDFEAAEILLRKHLSTNPNDPVATHMMAIIAASCGLDEDADRILRHSAHLNRDNPDALAHLGTAMHAVAVHTDRPDPIYWAVQVFNRALEIDPHHQQALAQKAEMMMQTRGLEEADATYQKLVAAYPHSAVYWMRYGQLLKSIGKAGKAVAAIRTALALDSSNGSWWWTLSDLKKATIFESDIELMTAALESEDMPGSQRVPLHFALGGAFDAAGEYAQAIEHIERGAEIRSKLEKRQPNPLIPNAEFIRETFTEEFFKAREGWGYRRTGPIFILGMHRAGSTLVEQILSSHSQIEGSEELFIINKFGNEILDKCDDTDRAQAIRSLDCDEFRNFGERYVELSSRSRQTDRPFLTDKYPGNWKFIGLIHCMLPNAKIIDVRRNPMDCCFANYFRYYKTASDDSFSQRGMGRFYADYIASMRHFDAVLPGRIHHVIHDDMVDDLEGQVRRLLDYIGVPFEENCLRFFETERAVHTPSSEQVRQPINRKGFGRWRRYEPWLGDLKSALGDIIENWRD